jgi:hypothetical protein
MNKRTGEPKVVTEDVGQRDLDPHWRWDRALQAPGHTSVDFETRVDFRRLQRYRLARAKQALKNSNLGALLVFDTNNVRYLTGTKIGEWERDKLCRFALLQYITASTAIGCRRRISAPACWACAAPCRRLPVS